MIYESILLVVHKRRAQRVAGSRRTTPAVAQAPPLPIDWNIREEGVELPRESRVLRVGDAAPEFVLPDPLTGEVVRLADLAGKPLLLYFGRGTWCPTCRQWLDTIHRNMSEFETRSAGVVSIMAQNPASMKAYLEAKRYPFPVLADATRDVSKQYGVYVRANFESINIARPANFVLDTKGTIRFIHIASVQFEYASLPDILAALDGARSPGLGS